MIRWREIVQPRMDEESATLRASYACFQITVENKGLSRNIKGAHFAVGFDRSHHHLPKGAPL